MDPERRPAATAPVADPAAPSSTLHGDLHLVAAILRKDRKATAQFVSEYADAVHGYVKHRLASRADLVDDVVQDVFVAALAGLASFRGTASLRAWLLGIARHKIEDHYRERLREPAALDSLDHAEPVADGPLPDETIDRDRLETRTHDLLRQLPEAYGVALLWRYWEGRSVREIAEATGKTEKAVERLLARARARFRELWEGKQP
jgi:RNA polymerase sigma-70 factor (ECF subfamily)